MTAGDANGGRYEAFLAGDRTRYDGDVTHTYAACASGTRYSGK
jgi:hypothetical protein